MSKLSVGIVGLPNVGKSTLFNALLKKQAAYAANFPFATIEPNVGIVPVPDARLNSLQKVIFENSKINPPIVPATVEFVDIAGLIAGAHKGEGLGNKFLSHIREVDAICHVVRYFSEEEIIKEGSVDPKSDFEIIKTELIMADLETLEKQREPKGVALKEEKLKYEIIKKLIEELKKGFGASDIHLSDDDKKLIQDLNLLTIKPFLVCLNVSENDLKNAKEIETKFASEMNFDENQIIAVCAKLEEQLAEFPNEEIKEFLNEHNLKESGLERIIQKAFYTLGLITFLTAGEKEVRAWTIKKGSLAPIAAGVIHTDFEKKFIKADVVSFDDFVNLLGWKNAREKGKVRQEGKDYEILDGDVIEFKIGS